MVEAAPSRSRSSWIRLLSGVVGVTIATRLLGFAYPLLIFREFPSPEAGLAYFYINTAYFVVQPISGGPGLALVSPIAAATSRAERGQLVRASLAVTVPALGIAAALAAALCIGSSAGILPMLVMVAGLSLDAIYFRLLTARFAYARAAMYRLTANAAQLLALAMLLISGVYPSVTVLIVMFSGSFVLGVVVIELQRPVAWTLLRTRATPTRSQLRALAIASVPTALAGIAYSGITGLDTFLMRVADDSAVASYGAAKSLASPAILISLAVTTVVQPEVAKASPETLFGIRARLLGYGAIGAVAISAAGIVTAGLIVGLLYGDRYPDAIGTLRWLIVALALISTHSLLQSWCLGVGKYWTPVFSLGVGAVTATSTNLMLVPVHGAQGAAFACAAGAGLALLVLTVATREPSAKRPT